MPVAAASSAIRIAVSDILSSFLSDRAWNEYDWEGKPLGALRDKVYEKYRPIPVDTRALRSELSKSAEVEMREQNRFLHLEPIKGKNMLPIVTMQSTDQWCHFRIYALLTMLDNCSALQSLAIRFETDEGDAQQECGIGSHDFCHAQLCKCITRDVEASTPDWLPDSQPSIPLDADNQVGLVLCMLTSLYGGGYVLRKLSVGRDRNLQKHLRRVRALRPPCPSDC